MAGFPKSSGGSSGLVLPNAAQYPPWHRALMKVMSGAGDAALLGLGDSILGGLFGNPGPGPMLQVRRMLAAALGVPVTDGLAIPVAGGLNNDPRWSVGAGWTNGTGSSGQSWGGIANPAGLCTWFGANGAAGSCLFQPPVGTLNYDTYDIYSIGGNFSCNFNLGANTVVGALPATVQKTTVTGTAAARPFCAISAPTGLGCIIVAVEPRLSTTPTLRVGNASATSASTGGNASNAGWTNTTAAAGQRPLDCITAANPDVGLVMLSVNDLSQGLSTAQTLANLSTILATLTACQGGNGGMILASENPCNPGTNPTAAQTALWASIKSFAARNGVPFIDIFSFLNGSTNGFTTLSAMNPDYYGDGNSIHPSTAGYMDMGRQLAVGLLAA